MSERAQACRRWLVAGAALGALAAPASARAQTTPASRAPGDATQVTEVVVTANKREERLVDVAGSVTALQGSDLERRQLLNLEDFAAQVSGLQIQKISPIRQRVILRGQNSGGAGATVSTVVDDVPFNSSSSILESAVFVPDIDPYDLNRVEVLRGPQGTLYGASAEGGIIKYVTNAPNLTRYQGGLEVGAFGVEHGEAAGAGKGFVNIPLVEDKLALRVNAYYEGLPGYVDNPLLGLKDTNSGDKIGGRASLLWKPTRDLSARFTVFSQLIQADGNGEVDVGGATFTPTAPPANRFDPVGSDYQRNNYFRTKQLQRASVYSANIDYDLHFARLSSITSYSLLRNVFVNDATNGAAAPPGAVPGFPLGLTNGTLYGLSYFGQPIAARIDQTTEQEKLSQEFRLSSEPGATLMGHGFDWQLGFFYTHETGRFLQFYHAFAPFTDTGELFTVAPLPTASLGGAQSPNSYREVSGYADAVFHFTPTLDLEAGVRYTDTRQYSATYTEGLLYSFVSGYAGGGTASDTATTFSVAPRWHFNPDSLLYVRVASGFRPGGVNYFVPGLPSDVPFAFTSDETLNYEVGLRSQLLDKKLSIDIAYFYIDWSRIQVTALYTSSTNGQLYSIIGNAGSAVSTGLEWNLSWRPTRQLTLQAIGAYTDAHLSKDAPALGGVDGEQLAYVPDVSNTVNVDYEWPAFGDYKAFVGGSWTYMGERYTDIGPTNPLGGTHIALPTYNTLAMQAGVRNGRYTFEVYARNLTDEFALSSYGDTGGFNPTLGFTGTANVIQPRTIGLRASASF